MKFAGELPDDVFWRVAEVAEKHDMTVPEFLSRVGARLAALSEPVTADPLQVLEGELRAARRGGWRAPHRGRRLSVVKREGPVVFTDVQMGIALAVKAKGNK